MPADRGDAMIKFESSSPSYNSSEILKGGSNMIEQSAKVVSVEPGYAWVIPQQKASSCTGCASGASSCSSSSPFDFMRAKEPQKMRVLNPLYARPGEQVIVGMQGEALVIYSVLAYLMPLLGLIVSAIVGNSIFAMLGLDAELGAIMAGAAGLLGGLRFANVFSSRSLHSPTFQPVILRGREQQIYAHILPSA
jgi:sigma-E factor negative regulatory protein RseC